MSASVPEADTRPVEGDPYAHDGGALPPTRVACPYCDRAGVTEARLNRCHNCGRWFEVIVDG